MSLTHRLAAGIPTVGVTALAALALAGSPAAATGEEASVRAKPAVMTTPCAEADRGEQCDYGYGSSVSPTSTGGTAATTAPTRGNGGYGSEAPTTAPTPSASVDTVPPGGVSPAASPSTSPTTPGGGVSPAGTLPLTGAPGGLTIALGALLVAGGAGAVYYTRRRRTA
ncbi:MAG: LPXTG cell wall anchor domain-containing protein [Actinoplanes sp.]